LVPSSEEGLRGCYREALRSSRPVTATNAGSAPDSAGRHRRRGRADGSPSCRPPILRAPGRGPDARTRRGEGQRPSWRRPPGSSRSRRCGGAS
jgi:hypothetical protein